MSKQTAMTRPLFEEPSAEHEREDPWSGPKGFMFGGMALPTLMELGQQYFHAAILLMEAIKHDKLEDYKLANPVLFLYRHSIELTLKGLTHSVADKHNLEKLAKRFEAYVKDRFGQQVPSWITARLKELAEIDPNSTAFRYAENRNRPVPGEIYVGLIHLQETMTALNRNLLSVWKADGNRERNLD